MYKRVQRLKDYDPSELVCDLRKDSKANKKPAVWKNVTFNPKIRHEVINLCFRCCIDVKIMIFIMVTL